MALYSPPPPPSPLSSSLWSPHLLSPANPWLSRLWRWTALTTVTMVTAMMVSTAKTGSTNVATRSRTLTDTSSRRYLEQVPGKKKERNRVSAQNSNQLEYFFASVFFFFFFWGGGGGGGFWFVCFFGPPILFF